MYGKINVIPPLLGAWYFLPQYASHTLFEEDVENLNTLATTHNWDFDLGFLKKEMRKPRKTILVTQTDRKIVYATQYFEVMTGYNREEVFGRKPDFLQGPGTDKKTTQIISKALDIPEKVTSTVVNYKKDGTPYFCDIDIFPVFDRKQQLVNFLAVEQEEDLF